ncbi:MAG: hypothetical protein D6730_03420 [Bacteroidetes bacterium]|nr:MAG: hypothetical protein D6730_03420 [Bacteroidota bacterium]
MKSLARFCLLLCCLLLACQDGLVPINIVMLGDSITAAGHWNEELGRADVLNRGRGGDTSARMLDRLQQDVLALSPRVCFLMAGANDQIWVAQREVSALDNIRSILRSLQQAGIQPVLQAVTLVGAHIPEAERRNQAILLFNQQLKQLATEEQLPYIDLNPQLAPQGFLADFYTTDGIHLQPMAYYLWAKEVQAILKTLDI